MSGLRKVINTGENTNNFKIVCVSGEQVPVKHRKFRMYKGKRQFDYKMLKCKNRLQKIIAFATGDEKKKDKRLKVLET